jgi:cyanophycin synthetase
MNSPLRVTATSAYGAVNIYASVPVIRMTVDVGLFKDWTIGQLGPRFDDALLELIPGARESGLASEDALSLAELGARIAVELQNQAGSHLALAASEHGEHEGTCEVIFEYEDERVGRRAGRLSIDLISDLIQARLRPPGQWVSDLDFEARLQNLIRVGLSRHLPIQDAAVVKAARVRGIEVIRIRRRIIQLGQGRSQQRLSGSKTTKTNVVSMSLSSNKEHASRLFGETGLPVARQIRVESAEAAVTAAEKIGYPVVIKPIRGNLGRGVTLHLTNRDEVIAAFKRASKIRPHVLVEQFIPGTDYRMLVIDGVLIAASKRVPAHVVGDGKQTVSDLVVEANRDSRRGSKNRGMWTALQLDERAHRILAQQGYDAASIPPIEEMVFLRDVANTSAGGTAVDVTDEVHPDNRAMAVRAARVVGLDVVGVDFLTTDISRSYREIGGAICEINSRPGLRKHMWPARGKPREVLKPILDMLFPPGTTSEIPIAVVTGIDAGTTARIAAGLLKTAGSTVGLAVGQGVEIDGLVVVEGQPSPTARARCLLLDPTVDAAVIEIAAADLVNHGLGFHNYQVAGVVRDEGLAATNASGSTKTWGDALQIVVDKAQALAVVNADEPTGLLLAKGKNPEQVCLVTTQADNPHVLAHLGTGGSAVMATSTEGSLTIYDHGTRVAVWSLPGFKGQMGSLGTAVAIAYGLGTSWQAIGDGLAQLDEVL